MEAICKKSLMIGQEFSAWLHDILETNPLTSKFDCLDMELLEVIQPFDDGISLHVSVQTNQQQAWVQSTWHDKDGHILKQDEPIQQLLGTYQYERSGQCYLFDLQTRS